MPRVAQSVGETTTQQQEKIAPKPWHRQPGESTLWYNRFSIYMEIGYKRTVQAAVEQERLRIKALKGTDTPPSSGGEKAKTVEKRRKTPQNTALVEVPKPKDVQVPGSWKRASIAWHWVERAQAWDNYAIEHMVEKNLEGMLENSHTLPLARIRTLQSMLTALSNTYNANNHKMTHEQDCLYIGRMQSILRDIREEMRVYDDSIQRAVMYRRCADVYKSLDQTTYAEVRQEQERRRTAKGEQRD